MTMLGKIIVVFHTLLCLMFATAGGVAPQLKSGRLRALAVTSAQPTPLVPGLPTVASSGLPGYEAVTVFGVFAPAAVPASLINKLNQHFARAARAPEVVAAMEAGGGTPVGNTPEEFGAFLKADVKVLAEVFKANGVTAN